MNKDTLKGYRDSVRRYFDEGEYEKAIHTLNVILIADIDKEENAVSYNDIGLAKYRLGKYKEAIKYFDEAIANMHDYSCAYYNRAEAYYKLEKYEDALCSYSEVIALEINPDVESYLGCANCKKELGEYKDAITDYDSVIKHSPRNAEAYHGRGLAKYHLDRIEEAIRDYNNAIELNSEYAEAYQNRGIARYELGNFSEAIIDFDELLELECLNAEAYRNRGEAKLGTYEWQDALKDFDIAIRLKPNISIYVYLSRATTKSYLGLHEEAIIDLDTFIKTKEHSTRAIYMRGSQYYRIGKYKKAEADYSRVIELEGEAYAYNSRGCARSNLGKIKEAIKDYDKSLELQPRNNPAELNRKLEIKKLEAKYERKKC